MTQLFGLVICGGKSNRMGEDKSLLNYNGIPQRYYLYEMLQSLCENVFISCNREQSNSISEKYNFITDEKQFENIGPMAALLSAFENHKDVSFLAVGCDYPFIKKEDLKRLIDARNENALAVSYFNKELSVEEPLLAIYESTSYALIKNNFENKKYSLRYFLQESNALKIFPSMPESIMSIDTSEQYQNVMRVIERQNG
ncbi:MAG: molybdenum cofactor guanylyltransferase [Bacteroidota bacterium]